MANRVFLGDLGSGDYRFRVSLPGVDVMDPTLTGNDLAFDSSLPRFGRVLFYGQAAFPSTGISDLVINFPVTLPAIPFVYAYLKNSDGRYFMINSGTNLLAPLVKASLDKVAIRMQDAYMRSKTVIYYAIENSD